MIIMDLDKRNTNFEKDLISYGKEGELIIANFFKDFGYNIDSYNNDSDYDFIMSKSGSTKKVEVKNDVKCITPTIPNLPTYDTGNIFIEYTSWGRRAGIDTTKADLYVYMFGSLKPREIWIIPVNKLKELIDKNEFIKTEDSGDKGSGTEGYLIPKWEYSEHFITYIEKNDRWIRKKNQN